VSPVGCKVNIHTHTDISGHIMGEPDKLAAHIIFLLH